MIALDTTPELLMPHAHPPCCLTTFAVACITSPNCSWLQGTSRRCNVAIDRGLSPWVPQNGTESRACTYSGIYSEKMLVSCVVSSIVWLNVP
jgi:hypothetical protein